MEKVLFRKRKNLAANGNLIRSKIEMIHYPCGAKGFKIDGKHYLLDEDGKTVPVYFYKNIPYINDWKRKLDRVFGISDEMFHAPTGKNNLIHAAMATVFLTVIFAVCFLVALLIQSI